MLFRVSLDEEGGAGVGPDPGVPVFETMAVVSLIALAANAACLALLWKHRAEDVNMSSVWECSRNDIASNLAVFVAAGAVWLACLFLRSAVGVSASALRELRGSGVKTA